MHDLPRQINIGMVVHNNIEDLHEFSCIVQFIK